MASKEEIIAALDAYHAAVRNEAISERKVDDLLETAIGLVPHARLTELVFYGERERSTEEIADEALHRECLWQSDGELAVLLHVYRQMERVTDDPNAAELDKHQATQGLRGIRREIDRIKAGSVH